MTREKMTQLLSVCMPSPALSVTSNMCWEQWHVEDNVMGNMGKFSRNCEIQIKKRWEIGHWGYSGGDTTFLVDCSCALLCISVGLQYRLNRDLQQWLLKLHNWWLRNFEKHGNTWQIYIYILVKLMAYNILDNIHLGKIFFYQLCKSNGKQTNKRQLHVWVQ